MRPIPWKVEPLPTLWMNPATGYAVDTNGRKISPVIRGRRKRPILEDILMPVMFELPGRDDAAAVLVTKDAVAKLADPEIFTHEMIDAERRRHKSA